MTRSNVIERLQAHRSELDQYKVASLELFGSTARNEASEQSDVDLLVTFTEPVGLFTFFRLKDYLAEILEVENVDLVPRKAVLDELKDDIYAGAVPCL